jgi:hypothetical protein
MNWSKLRKRIRENISPDLRDRIDLHVAVYRESHDADYGRAWITIDGKQVASWSCMEQLLSPQLELGAIKTKLQNGQDYSEIASELGIYSQKEFVAILSEYLNTDPHSALASKVPLARALAIVDRRIGKRTLQGLAIDQENDPLALVFFALRMERYERANDHRDAE